MTHAAYVDATRRQVRDIAMQIIEGRVPVLEGCLQIAALRDGVEVEERDADFDALLQITDAIESLPVGRVRAHWSEAAIAEATPRIEAVLAWAMPDAMAACRSLVARFA